MAEVIKTKKAQAGDRKPNLENKDEKTNSEKEEQEQEDHLNDGGYLTTEFQPPFFIILFVSKRDSGRKRLSFFLWLPSCCGQWIENARHAVRILDDGSFLDYNIL